MSTLEIQVDDASAVAEARRRAVAAARLLQFDELRAGELALVATELATNLLKHGGGGRLLLDETEARIDLLAIDRGRGMADIGACLADGYSTTGTPGTGLGAVRRLADHFEVGSWPGQGTAVLASMAREKPGADAPRPRVGGVMVPKQGEAVSGDGWSSHEDASGCTVFVVDGLGHGTGAAVAANEAVKLFQRHCGEPPSHIIEAVHRGLRHTRGGAVAAARIDWASRTVAFAGVGNIAGVVVGPDRQLRRMVSHNGTAGHVVRKIQSFDYPCGHGPMILHSDGIATSWSLDAYAGLPRAHPLLLAGVLYRDFARARDDATVVVAATAQREPA